MADIFISYSKSDHALALKLSAFLEAEGWSVWWDKSLGAADLYRDEIMKQLAAARAVISIWTPNSIQSDWVRAEAGRAKADGKLIPVKTADVAYGDIPLPFGEMHTENIASTDLIRAAVVAQLAKPEVKASGWALLTKGFKYEVLTWIGIVGGALTLFTNLGAVLKLADWARVLVQHWKEWTHAFWVWAFGWLGIHLPPEWTPVLSFLLFGSLLTIGQAVKFRSEIKPQPIVDSYQGKAFRLISWRTLFFVTCVWIGEFSWISVSNNNIKYLESIFNWAKDFLPNNFDPEVITMPYILAPAIIFVVIFSKHKLYATMAILLIVIFFTLIMYNQLLHIPIERGKSFNSAATTAVIMMWFLPLILLSVAPAKAVSRRLIYLAIGLLLLIALNELSKLGIDVTAPKLQG